MKKNIIFGTSLVAIMLAVSACGGAAEEDATSDETEAVEAVVYTIDAEASVINWWNVEGGEKGHTGTVNVLDGSYTVEGDVITSASMNVDMQSIVADNERLAGHLMTGHFFNVMSPDTISADSIAWVPNMTTSTFTFDRHEEGMIYGTVNAADLDFAVEAPATVSEGQIEIGEFSIDMSGLTYFIMELDNVEVPEEDRHDPNIGFSATIVGTK